MRRIHRKTRKDGEKGTAIVEMACVLPVLVLVIVGIVDLGRAVWLYHTLGYAARDASRYASVRSSGSGDPATQAKITTRILTEAPALHQDLLGVNTTWTPSNSAGGVVRVRLTYEFDALTPLVPRGLLTLRTASRMAISN